MAVQDAFQAIDSLDPETIARFVSRLEQRGSNPTFSSWRDAYLDRLDLGKAANVLDIGCGTGVVSRAIARRKEFNGRVTGIDPSESLLRAAVDFSAAEGVAGSVRFEVGDGGALGFENASFDRIVAHTTISHVPDPHAMLREVARVVKPNGMVAIFDGDYASWTFDYPDSNVGQMMDEALCAAVVANPRVMRGLRREFRATGLEVSAILSWIYVDSGAGDFYAPALAAYAPVMVRSYTATAGEVDHWLSHMHRAMKDGEFFGACNYYAYIGMPSTGWESSRP